MFFDVVKGMIHKVPVTKLVLKDLDLHPYLAVLLVAVFYKSGDAIRVTQKGNGVLLTEKEFENFLANEGAIIHNDYSTLPWEYCLHSLHEEPAH